MIMISCFQFQGVQHDITDIMQKMYSKVGTPENCKEMEKEWILRLAEIDSKLKAFQESHVHHPCLPDPHQVCLVMYHLSYIALF